MAYNDNGDSSALETFDSPEHIEKVVYMVDVQGALYTVEYMPDEMCVTQESINLWIAESEQAVIELRADELLCAIVEAIDPLKVSVVIEQASAGGSLRVESAYDSQE